MEKRQKLTLPLNGKQEAVLESVRSIAKVLGVSQEWASAIALTESSLGLKQKSPTGCRGVFQMSSVAMKDLLWEMENVQEDETIDICCGILYLKLLLKRHLTVEKATGKYCDPNDREFYVPKVMRLMKEFGE